MADSSTPTLSPLLQSLTSVVAQVADLERQRAADVLRIDNLYQETVELRARVQAYETEMQALLAQADVDRRSLAEAGELIDQLRKEVKALKAGTGGGTGGEVKPPPVDPTPNRLLPDFLIRLGDLEFRPYSTPERWKRERRWVFDPDGVLSGILRVVVDIHDEGQTRVTIERCAVTLPHTAPVLTLPLRVEIDGKVRHDAPVRLHHHQRPPLVFDRREHSPRLVASLMPPLAPKEHEALVPRFGSWVGSASSASIPEAELARIGMGTYPWNRWREGKKVYDPVSEEYGQVVRSWTGGAGPLLNEAAMLMPVQVAYLLSGDPRAWAEVVRLADSSGNYAIHYRLPDGRFPRADETAALPFLQGDPPVRLSTASGVTLPVPDVSHQHSLVYLAYLLTGERYYYEELQSWWTYNLLTRPKSKERARGIFWSGEVRASAWALRSLLHLVLASEAGSKEHAEYESYLREILHWMRDTFTEPSSPHYRATGILAIENWRPSGMLQFANAATKPQWFGTWMIHVMAYVLGECVRAGYREAVPMRDHLLRVARACWLKSPSRYLAPWGNHAVPTQDISGASAWWHEVMEQTFANMPANDPHRTAFSDPLTPDYIGWFRAAVVTAVDAGQGPEWADEALKWLDAEVPKSRWKELPLVWRVEPAGSLVDPSITTSDKCIWCGRPLSEHVESRPAGEPVPRVPCGLLRSKFVPAG